MLSIVLYKITRNALPGLFFGLMSGISFAFAEGIIYGLLAGVVCGIVFGLISTFLFRPALPGNQILNKYAKEKTILYSGRANHFRNFEAVGGVLILSPDELLFKSHGWNLLQDEWAVELSQIRQTGFFNTLFFNPNGFIIALNNGKEERLMVDNRNHWKTAIENAMRETTQ